MPAGSPTAPAPRSPPRARSPRPPSRRPPTHPDSRPPPTTQRLSSSPSSYRDTVPRRRAIGDPDRGDDEKRQIGQLAGDGAGPAPLPPEVIHEEEGARCQGERVDWAGKEV